MQSLLPRACSLIIRRQQFQKHFIIALGCKVATKLTVLLLAFLRFCYLHGVIQIIDWNFPGDITLILILGN